MLAGHFENFSNEPVTQIPDWESKTQGSLSGTNRSTVVTIRRLLISRFSAHLPEVQWPFRSFQDVEALRPRRALRKPEIVTAPVIVGRILPAPLWATNDYRPNQF